MKLEKKTDEFFTLSVSLDELSIINNALNEICNGLPEHDFENRVGAPIDEALTLLKEVNEILKNTRTH